MYYLDVRFGYSVTDVEEVVRSTKKEISNPDQIRKPDLNENGSYSKSKHKALIDPPISRVDF